MARAAVARQAFGRGKREAGVRRCCSQHSHGVAADLRLGQDRLHPPGDGRVSSRGQPPERDREPPQRPKPHLLHEQPEHRRRQLASEHERLARQPWREVVDCIAGGEQTRPARAAPSHMSSWTSAPPVSLPTRVTSCRSRRSRNSATSLAIPGSDRSAPTCIGRRCAPSGSVPRTGGRRTGQRSVRPTARRPSSARATAQPRGRRRRCRYSLVPAGSSISVMPVCLGAARNPRGRGHPLANDQAGASARRTARPRQPPRGRPGTARNARRASGPARRGQRAAPR